MTSFGEAPPYSREEYVELCVLWTEYLQAIMDDSWGVPGAWESLGKLKGQLFREDVIARLMSTVERQQKELDRLAAGDGK
jgi:hypothetical protein